MRAVTRAREAIIAMQFAVWSGWRHHVA